MPSFSHLVFPALVLILAYLLGAIPVGYIVAKLVKGIDIREHGSGNVGATNVKRVVGTKAGLVTFALDGLKGYVPVLGTIWLFNGPGNPGLVQDPYQVMPLLTALAAIVGHSKSVFIGFSGGKSVMTSLGCFLALNPLATLITFAVGVTVIKLTRYVSVGSMVGALVLPTSMALLGAPLSHVGFTGLVSLYVIYLHRGNVHRLLTHQENRL